LLLIGGKSGGSAPGTGNAAAALPLQLPPPAAGPDDTDDTTDEKANRNTKNDAGDILILNRQHCCRCVWCGMRHSGILLSARLMSFIRLST
jgi:hypothetical protein